MAHAFSFLTLAALATAQTTTILTLPFYGYDQQPIVASVLSANPSATTLSLTCAPGTDASDCGLFPAQTLTIGPSTYNMFMGEGSAFTGTQDCSSTRQAGTAAVVCAESNAGSGANYPGSSTAGYEGTDVVQIPVTVTAGVEALGGGRGSASTGSSGSSAPASASATATSSGEVTMLTGTASSASSSRSGSESSSSTGSATGSAAAMTSSSAASVDGKAGGGMVLLLVAGAEMLGYWMS